ncbi:MAG: TonB-dependent receptor [Thiobacillus sp.]|nr:TonB-dependent receptor [Thiobacillus sp.]
MRGRPRMAAGDADFFAEMPVVLTVSRLAQPLDETPGAVTVIDRETIRRSGARELAELLRLVPGFVVSHFDGGARPFVNYHADYDAYSRRIQVYIDGRSVYSGLVIGSSLYGMMGVVLEDIERIEVLRGSNSAAYGANAFLGVINIVTRHAEDARGGLLAVNYGSQGVRDGTARIGWGDGERSYRLTAATRRDHGFDASTDDKRVDQVHFRADLNLGGGGEMGVNAGFTRYEWTVPADLFPGHGETWRDGYAQMQWRQPLGQADELRFSLLVEQEAFKDFYPLLRADGVTTRINVNAEHAFAMGHDWRIVWGGEFRNEAIDSNYLFAGDPERTSRLWRLFGNAEWRPAQAWLVNAGGLWEHQSDTGGHLAPRLMVNYHLTPDHTLRIGSSRAYKVPSQLESKGDWRMPDILPIPLVSATGDARPERIDAHEIGYLGNFPAIGLNADVRLFRERIAGVLQAQSPPGQPYQWDYVNKDANIQQGWEMQLRWRPLPDTEVLLNHAEIALKPDADSSAPQDAYRAPGHVSTLALFQRLPHDFDLSLIWYRVGEMFWIRKADTVPAYDQLDLRLAKTFRLEGGRKAELALVAQAVDGEHREYSPNFSLGRRVFASLRTEF